MASGEVEIKISDEVAREFQKMKDDLVAAKAILSEERIRAIVRDELVSCVQQLLRGSGKRIGVER